VVIKRKRAVFWYKAVEPLSLEQRVNEQVARKLDRHQKASDENIANY